MQDGWMSARVIKRTENRHQRQRIEKEKWRNRIKWQLQK